MPRPYRTWRVEVARDGASILSDTQATLLEGTIKIHEFEEDDAALQLLAILGLALVPCCFADKGDEPCAECAAQLKGDAIDRAVDLALDRATFGGPR